ncbi:hypothetical protein [Micromonospora coerulea]|uniref:hypothetical protein n=1 Tax=Micromonospora coerulea TaxID=47856 RepID=UPI00190311C1|nr:hypothetical protein [Micromonospora veneta]
MRRLVDKQLREAGFALTFRKEWTDEQFEALADHPDRKVRELLAQAVHVTPEQRARLVEDPEPGVLRALAEGPDWFLAWTWTPQPALPTWAYERLLERKPRLELIMADSPWLPQDLRARLWPAGSPPAPADEPPPDRREAEAQAGADNEWTRVTAAADPRLPADLVARLAVDPSPAVRLAVSMRPSSARSNARRSTTTSDVTTGSGPPAGRPTPATQRSSAAACSRRTSVYAAASPATRT